jgi:hypothetical protein
MKNSKIHSPILSSLLGLGVFKDKKVYKANEEYADNKLLSITEANYRISFKIPSKGELLRLTI